MHMGQGNGEGEHTGKGKGDRQFRTGGMVVVDQLPVAMGML